jgi:hypothetical protein
LRRDVIDALTKLTPIQEHPPGAEIRNFGYEPKQKPLPDLAKGFGLIYPKSF